MFNFGWAQCLAGVGAYRETSSVPFAPQKYADPYGTMVWFDGFSPVAGAAFFVGAVEEGEVRNKIIIPLAVPEGIFQALIHRIAPLIEYWGQNCRWVSVDMLGFSCYSQGLQDGMQLVRQRGLPNDEPQPEYFI